MTTDVSRTMNMPRKIGIFTFHCVDNFGAVLQCYALQKAISSIGFQSDVIDYCPSKLLEPFRIFQSPFVEGRSGLGGKIRAMAGNIIYALPRLMRRRKYHKFRATFLKTTPDSYSDQTQLGRLADESYSHYVTGSDQVWNANILGGIDPAYFLGFPSCCAKRIAYAVSLGEEVPTRFYPDFRRYLPGFSSVSVREKSAQAFVQGFADKPVNVVLDPTFLIPIEEWVGLARLPSRKNYIFVYDIWTGPLMQDIVNFVSGKLGLKVISYSNRGLYRDAVASCFFDGPAEFLGLLLNADFVVTSSYHGTTLSIANKKRFLTVPHPTRGARMADLLGMLGMSPRLIRDVRELAGVDLEADVNYSTADAVLWTEIKESLSFLKSALE